MVTPAQHIGIEPPHELGAPARPGWPRNDAQRCYRGHLQGDPQAQARVHGYCSPSPAAGKREEPATPLDRPSQDVLGRIDESGEDIADLAMRLGNTFGPVG